MQQRPAWRFLALQLSLGLLWLWLLPLLDEGGLAQDAGGADQVRWMLLWAGWCPGIPLAIGQARRRERWRWLLVSDLLGGAALILLSCSAYLPLFFIRIPWFWLFALPPRGLLTAALLRVSGQEWRWR